MVPILLGLVLSPTHITGKSLPPGFTSLLPPPTQVGRQGGSSILPHSAFESHLRQLVTWASSCQPRRELRRLYNEVFLGN